MSDANTNADASPRRRRSARLPLLTSLLMVLLGLLMWTTMPRQEDPSLPDRWAAQVAIYPGATPEEVESALAVPIEQALQSVDHIRDVESTSRADVLVLTVELDDGVYDVEQHWQRVRDAIATVPLPPGASLEPLDTRLTRQESMLLAVTRDAAEPDLVVLSDAARALRRRVLRRARVREVTVAGAVDPELSVIVDEAKAWAAGLDTLDVAQTIASRTGAQGLGSVHAGDFRVGVRGLERAEDAEAIAALELVGDDGSLVRLGALAQIERRAPPRPLERVRVDGQPAVLLGVVAEPGVDLVRFGDELRGELDALEAELQAELDDPSVSLTLVVDQPRYVAARLLDLQRSLLLSTLIVALVLLVTMGPRMAVVCAAMVPLAILSAVAVFGIGGGVLHQISLAGGVIAIGMVVDNAIVVVEEIQRRLDEGEAPPEAARASARALLEPLGASTATTVAAFLPMLLNSGAAADFTRAIPVMVILALLTSFAFSLFVLPPVASLVLRPRRRPENDQSESEGESKPARSLGVRVVDRLLRRPALALLPGLAMIVMAATALPSLRVRFFPPTKRHQAVVELQLREGTHVDAVAAVSGTVEGELQDLDAVEQLTATVGRGLPHFYYNLPETKAQSNFAQMLVQLRTPEEVEAVEASVESLRAQLPPGTKLRVARLKQGPPVVAPVELLLYSPRLDELRTSARAVAEALAEVEGLTAVRDSIDAGAPSLRFDLDRARSQPWGVDEAALRASLLPHTAGLPAGTVLHGQRHEPVVVRAAPRRELAPSAMDLPGDLAVAGSRGRLRVAEVSDRALEWAPAAITRKTSKRFARVTAELEPGVELDAVRGAIEARVAALELDDAGVAVAFAGEAESAEEANDSLLRALPVGLVILVLVLVWEFDSLRCVGLVLVTVPLAAVGVIPALAVGGQPFGFMSALGVVALIGVVVNNAIVLLDLTQQLRAEGWSTREAVRTATLRRVRPILLTTATTVVGLVPLLVSNTSLWPPLALTIISGLLASTVLTLVTLPALAMLVLPLGARR